jgi:hypothetical protein
MRVSPRWTAWLTPGGLRPSCRASSVNGRPTSRTAQKQSKRRSVTLGRCQPFATTPAGPSCRGRPPSRPHAVIQSPDVVFGVGPEATSRDFGVTSAECCTPPRCEQGAGRRNAGAPADANYRRATGALRAPEVSCASESTSCLTNSTGIQVRGATRLRRGGATWCLQSLRPLLIPAVACSRSGRP